MPSLTLTRKQMRTLGYRVVDQLVDHFAGLRDKPAAGRADRPTMERRLREPMPASGTDPLVVLERTMREVLDPLMHVDHPRFFGFVPGPSNFVSAMADALAAGLNVFAGTWLEAPGPSQVELVVVDWLRELCGLPEAAGGLFVSGGSMANITALAAARHIRLGDDSAGATIYCSTETHHAIRRAAWLLGFKPDQLRELPADDAFRLSPELLRQAIERDRAAGLRPFFVVANAGTTSTGAIDPLGELAVLCREQELWLHADAAYGAGALFCEQGQKQLSGLSEVDSLALDPHKWLFQPYEIGCVLVRDQQWLLQTFRCSSPYLDDAVGGDGEINFCDRGLQLTRSFRALKLWMSIQVFGREAFTAAVERGLELARLAEQLLRGQPYWEIVTPAQLGVVTFRLRPPAGVTDAEVDALQSWLLDKILHDGFAVLTGTRLHGRPVLRLCTINPRTTPKDLFDTFSRLEQLVMSGA